MEQCAIIRYNAKTKQKALEEFENAIYDSLCKYSLSNFRFADNLTEEIIHEALQKSLQICKLAGINCEYHFKKVFVCDAMQHEVVIDWKMSKKAMNLMVTQISKPDHNTAQWIWKLVDV